MRDAFRDVMEFQAAAGREIPERPGVAGVAGLQQMMNLITEEHDETRDAMRDAQIGVRDGRVVGLEDVAEIADGLADLVWVCLAAAVQLGVDLPAVWGRVKAANMAKFGPGAWKDEHGKVRKPEGWTPPDVVGALAGQKPIAETYADGA
jgi:predicted HAD superfamily Cof-like phosphohydrolase